MEVDVEVVKGIIEHELPRALDRLWEKRAPEMQAAIARNVIDTVRPEFKREHAENRARFEVVEKEARLAADASREAAVASSKAETVAKSILARMEDHHSVVVETQKSLTILSAEIAADRGERLGAKKERSRGVAIARWIFGGGVGTAIVKVYEHWRGK